MGEVNHLAHGVRFYAEAATKLRGAYQELPSTMGSSYGMVIRRPMGVCAAITPYNFPLTLLGTKVAPALASGNTVVAKPAATTPLATLRSRGCSPRRACRTACSTWSPAAGRRSATRWSRTRTCAASRSPGSTPVGRHIAGLAGPDLKRLSLELGGSDPVIICADADVEAAVKAVIIGRYWNAGQACLGCKRVFVHDYVHDDFVSQLVDRVGRYEPGDGSVKAEKPKLRMGPIHTKAGRDELLEQIEDAPAASSSSAAGTGATRRAGSSSRR